MVIPFQCIWHGSPSRVLKNRFIYRIEEVDVLRGELRFSEVIRFDCRDPLGIDCYAFHYFRYDLDRGVITINCTPDLELLICVKRICIEYKELEYRGKAHVTIGWFWDSDSGPLNEE